MQKLKEKFKQERIGLRIIDLLTQGLIVSIMASLLAVIAIYFSEYQIYSIKVSNLLFIVFLLFLALGSLLFAAKGLPLIKGYRKLNSGLELLLISLPIFLLSLLLFSI